MSTFVELLRSSQPESVDSRAWRSDNADEGRDRIRSQIRRLFQQPSFRSGMAAGIGGIFAVSTAAAAGLGQAQVLSGLGQPLRVEIPLISLSESEAAQLSARITSPLAYQEAGIADRTIRDRIRTRLVDLGTSAARLELRTVNGVDDTVIPLLVELNWPNGRLQREYMVLLNPSDATSSDSAVFANDASASTATSQSAENGSLTPISSALPVERSQYVQVQPGDTLATVVNRILPQGATRFQGMIAIYELNPDAFVEQNIHLIRSGAQLSVPDENAILSYPRETARNRFNALVAQHDHVLAETEAIANNSDQPLERSESNESQAAPSDVSADVAANSQSDAQAARSTDGFSLQILPADDLVVDGPTQTTGVEGTESEAQLAGGALSAQMQSFSTSLELMTVSLAALQEENQVLKDRLQKLEDRVGLLIQFISADDLRQAGLTDLASISGSEELATAENPSATDERVNSSVTELAATAGNERSDATQIEQDIVQQQLLDGLSNQVKLELGETDLTAPAEGSEAEAKATSETSGIATSDAGLAANDPASFSLFSRYVTQPLNNLFGNGIPTWLGWVAGLMTALVVWLLWSAGRRRDDDAVEKRQPSVNPERSTMQSADQSYLRPSESGGVSYIHPDEENAVYVSDDEDSTLLILDDSIGSMDDGDVTQNGRVDSITESEVYMTYDRPYQAIRVLEDDYERGGPNRPEIAIKLLGIYEELAGRLNIEDPQAHFIQRLHSDRETFTSYDWQRILEKVNESQMKQPVAESEVKKTPRSQNGLQYDENGDLIFKRG
ncbi:MAG: FimV/HubP family polar landmark protein [Pseudomonadota bacterium]